MDLSVDTSCGREVVLYRFFPTRTGISPLVYVYQPPPSSRASPLALLTASTRGPKYLSGQVRILFHSAQAIVRILFDMRVLFEEIRYSKHTNTVFQTLMMILSFCPPSDGVGTAQLFTARNKERLVNGQERHHSHIMSM